VRWPLRRGGRPGEAADLVGVHYKTVQQWVAWYRPGGLAEVRHHRNGGRLGAPSRLSPAQFISLPSRARAVRRQRRSTTNSVSTRIHVIHGIHKEGFLPRAPTPGAAVTGVSPSWMSSSPSTTVGTLPKWPARSDLIMPKRIHSCRALHAPRPTRSATAAGRTDEARWVPARVAPCAARGGPSRRRDQPHVGPVARPAARGPFGPRAGVAAPEPRATARGRGRSPRPDDGCARRARQ
jgi:transposase